MISRPKHTHTLSLIRITTLLFHFFFIPFSASRPSADKNFSGVKALTKILANEYKKDGGFLITLVLLLLLTEFMYFSAKSTTLESFKNIYISAGFSMLNGRHIVYVSGHSLI